MNVKELKQMLEERKPNEVINLIEADLRALNLAGLDLSGAIMYGANMTGVNMSRAIMSRAIMSRANMTGAIMSRANMSRAIMYGANMTSADMYGANMTGANMSYAIMSYANMTGADMTGAIMTGANTDYIKYNYRTIGMSNCPDGELIGWKKVQKKLVKLLIPKQAKRSRATTSKCRCSHAIVLDIEGGRPVTSRNDCVYEIGKFVWPDKWNEDRWDECSHGIHFLLDKNEAINW